MRNRLKALIIEKLNYWHIVPSAEERENMSPGEIQTFIANAIRNLRHEDGFLHSGSDDEVSRQPSLTRCLLMSHRAMLLGSTIPLSSRLLKSLCTENTVSSPSFLTNSICYVQSPAWL